MIILAIDDEQYALEQLKAAIMEAVPDANLFAAKTAEEGLLFAKLYQVDVVFLDRNLCAGNGLSLVERLQEFNEDIHLVFVTGNDGPEDIRNELDHLLYKGAVRQRGIYVRTFGNFDIYVDGRCVPFPLRKAKEMLAYLINRDGACVTERELAAVLFAERRYTRKVQIEVSQIYVSLKNSLEEAGAGEILVKGRKRYAVDASKYSTDIRRIMERKDERR